MNRFIEGTDRSQATLFPDRLEDWIGEDNSVRVIDVFVDTLDLNELGFERAIDPKRPSAQPRQPLWRTKTTSTVTIPAKGEQLP